MAKHALYLDPFSSNYNVLSMLCEAILLYFNSIHEKLIHEALDKMKVQNLCVFPAPKSVKHILVLYFFNLIN